jgi:O-antigen/teichoic acid export membrane protein
MTPREDQEMNTGTAKQEATGIAVLAKQHGGSNGNGTAPERGGFAQKLARWTGKGGLAILDQGLISGSNFLISILLARWLMPDAYGAYAVAFGIWVMLSLIYQSLVLEPMGVFGPSIFRENLRGYLRSLVSIHVALSITLCSGLAIWWAIAHWQGASGATIGALAGLVFASPCLLLFNLARRTFYVELSPAPAAAGAFVYSAVVLAGLWFVNHRGLLSPLTAFLLIGIGALVTALVLIVALRAGLSGSGAAPAVGSVWRQHWRYGAWALASAIAGWLPSYIYFPLLSVFSGMERSGELKALMNLVQPFEQTRGALLMLVLPFAAGVMAKNGKAGARVLGFRLTLLGAAGAILYWAVIIPLHGPVFQLLYKGRYTEVAYLLPLLALGQVFWSATFGPAIALRAMKSPFSVFVALSVATVASLMVGVPATWAFGLKGAIWGSNAADLFSLVALFIVFRRKLASDALGEETADSKWFGARGERQAAMALGASEEI